MRYLIILSLLTLGCNQQPVPVEVEVPRLIEQWSPSDNNDIYLNIYEYNGNIYLIFIHREMFDWEIEILPLNEWNPHTNGDIEYEGTTQ